MNFLIFDLEWNIVGRKNKPPKEEQEKLPFEIIEIGAIKLNYDLETIDTFSCYVKPVLYPIISRYVARVTQRDQRSMAEGVHFPQAAAAFFAFVGQDPVLFCSWSKADPKILLNNLNYYGLKTNSNLSCLDVQSLFAVAAEQVKKTTQRSIEYALKFLGIENEGPLHTAENDAIYTAKILKAIWMNLELEAEEKTLLLADHIFQVAENSSRK